MAADVLSLSDSILQSVVLHVLLHVRLERGNVAIVPSTILLVPVVMLQVKVQLCYCAARLAAPLNPYPGTADLASS